MVLFRAYLWPILGVAVLLSLPLGHAEEEADRDIELSARAKPVNNTPPVYPRIELLNGRQGWVELSFVINEDGNVIDPVVQDSSGSGPFEYAALKTVEDWTYEPATWGGERVQQSENKVLIAFAIEGEEDSVTAAFNRLYRKVDKKLLNRELESAREILDESFDPLGMTLTELAWYSALEVRYFGQTGDKEAQLRALRKATASDGRWVDDGLYPQLLLLKTIRELEAGNVSAGLSTFQKLEATEAELPELENLQPIVDRLRDSIAGNELIRVPATVPGDPSCDDCNENWNYDLLRQKFSLARVSGELGNLEIRCSRMRIVDKAREGISWETPDSWGSCSVIVFGEPGATFELLEEPWL